MPESAKMIIVLTLISAFASFGLGAFNDSTLPLILENERQFTLRSIKKVMPLADKPNPCEKTDPKFDNDPNRDTICFNGTTIYRGRKGSDIVGLAVVSVGDKAYSGTITTLVGLSPDGLVTGIEVLKHAETPGLGAKIEECAWRGQLVGKGPSDMVWKVTKDGGEVDQISGATISSRSMIDSVLKAQKLLTENKDAVMSAEPMAEGEVCNAR
ncbi:MAG: RnfABCDGE type electron transport complex subunit G [Proteobacteria bacterium]|nr:RnfABCDGE type electron transport complex subunit G [Pseudomonadota bacterium]